MHRHVLQVAPNVYVGSAAAGADALAAKGITHLVSAVPAGATSCACFPVDIDDSLSAESIQVRRRGESVRRADG